MRSFVPQSLRARLLVLVLMVFSGLVTLAACKSYSAPN